MFRKGLLTNPPVIIDFAAVANPPAAIALTVADNFGVTVTNTVALSGGDLRLVGEAQLIQTHLGVNTNVIGSGKLLREVHQANLGGAL